MSRYQDIFKTWDRGDGTAFAALGGGVLIVDPVGNQTNTVASDTETELSAEDVAICKALGVDPDDFKQTLIDDQKDNQQVALKSTTNQLDSTALAVCKQMGIDTEDYLKTLKED